MDLLKNSFRRRTLISEVAYIALNIALAVSLMLVIRITDSLALAFVLVLLSKWRIFAVRPRFWFANLQANMVNITMSVGYVVFLYSLNQMNASDAVILSLQLLLVALDSVWLILIKPRSKRSSVVLQAGLALFVGVTAIFIMSYGWYSSVVVALVWLVGYGVARHVLNAYDDESHITFLSSAWGLIIAQVAWLQFHWTIGYKLPLLNTMYLPQVSVVIAAIGFVSYKVYDSYFHHKRVRGVDVVLPLIFSVGLISVLMLFFNEVSPGI
jgi:hypothetical protein